MSSILDSEKLVIDSPELGRVLYVPGLPGGSNKLYDRSPYCHIGTINGATWQRTASGIWFLSYDGIDDYVNFGNAASLDITGEITIESWVKPSSSQIYDYGVLLIKSGSYQLDAHSNSQDYPRFIIWLASSGVQVKTSTTLITDDVWSFLVATFDGDKMRLYQNAVLTDEWDVSNEDIAVTANNLILGASSTAPGDLLKGGAALPRIYNCARTALQIQNDFSREKHLFGVW